MLLWIAQMLTLAAFLASVSSTSHARTWYVKADGTGDAPTLEAAVDSSAEGDEILVGPGTHQIEWEMLLKNDMVATSENGPWETRIVPKPMHYPPSGFSCVGVYSVTISGLWFEGFGGGPSDFGPITVYQSSGLHIENNVFVNNRQAGIAILAVVPGQSEVYIEHNTIVGNMDTNMAMIGGNSRGFVTSNILWGQVFDVEWFDAVGGNCMQDTLDAGWFAPFNFSADPQFCGASAGNYYLQEDSPCVDGPGGGWGLIGALPVGCGAVSVEPTSWGRIKAIYDE